VAARRGALAGAALALGVAGCGGGGGAGPADAAYDQSVDVTFFDTGNFGADVTLSDAPPTPPPPPVLGPQIDRVGRPGVTLALVAPFAAASQQGPARDAYNADAVPSRWGAYTPALAASLAVYDGLDGICGNQLGYAGGYGALGSMLGADALWVDTSATTCAAYLAVERSALGAALDDCGGWTLTEPAMDVTYNALAGTLGAGSSPGPVVNGITAPASAPLGAFPYLAAPH